MTIAAHNRVNQVKRWLFGVRLEKEAIMATKNQPVKEVRLGRIKAVIWKNPGSNGNGPLLNTTLARLYKEPESDNWKESQTLGRGEPGVRP